eukprot:Rmarinus@m.2958
MKSENLKAYARFCPPPLGSHQNGGTATAFGSRYGVEYNSTKHVVVYKELSRHDFTLDGVFPPHTSQQALFETAALPVINGFIDGHHGTFLAFGQPGSGKTYSLFEEGKRDSRRAGLLERSASLIFQELPEQRENMSVSVRASCCEVNTEHVFDLLDASLPTRNVREHPVKGRFLEGLVEKVVESVAEVISVVHTAFKNRKQSSHANPDGHLLFFLSVERIGFDGKVRYGRLCFGELSSGERIPTLEPSRTSSVLEARRADRSIASLHTCVKHLAQGKSHVPYRDSKLTRILQDSLSGTSRTALIVTASPAPHSLDETISTLKFATTARCIKGKPSPSPSKVSGEFETLAAKYKAWLAAQLKYSMQLEALLLDAGVSVPSGVRAPRIDPECLAAASNGHHSGGDDFTVHSEDIARLSEELQLVTEARDSLADELDNARYAIDESQRDVRTLRTELEEIVEKRQEERGKFISLEQELGRLKKSLEETTARANTAEHRADDLHSETITLQGQLEAARGEIASLRIHADISRDREESLMTAKQDISTLEEKLSRCRQELQKAVKAKGASESLADMLRSEVLAIAGDMDAAIEEVRAAQGGLEEKSALLAAAEARTLEAERAHAKATEMLRRLAEENADFESCVQQLRASEELQSSRVSELEATVESLQTELESQYKSADEAKDWENTISKLKATYEDNAKFLQDQLDAASNELESKDSTIINIRRELELVRGDFGVSERKVSELEQQLHTWQGKCEETTSRLSRLELDAASWEDKLKAVEDSARAAESERREMALKLSEETNEKLNVQEAMTELKRRVETLDKEISVREVKYTTRNDDLVKELEALRHSMEETQRARQAAEERARRAEDIRREQQVKYDALSKSEEEASEKAGFLQLEIGRLRDNIGQLLREREDLQKSNDRLSDDLAEAQRLAWGVKSRKSVVSGAAEMGGPNVPSPEESDGTQSLELSVRQSRRESAVADREPPSGISAVRRESQMIDAMAKREEERLGQRRFSGKSPPKARSLAGRAGVARRLTTTDTESGVPKKI